MKHPFALLTIFAASSLFAGEHLPGNGLDRSIPECGAAEGQLLFAQTFNAGKNEDLTEGGHHGTDVGVGATYQDGNIYSPAHYLDLDTYGGNYALTVPAGCQQMTIMAWVKCEQTTTGTAAYCSSQGGNAHKILSYVSGPNAFRFEMNTTGGYVALTGTTTATVGEWYHLVGTYSGAASTLWVNGNSENDSAQFGNIDNHASETTQLGARTTANGATTIDEVRVYLRVLTTEEILDAYHGGPSK
jgi:hypothetical protein